MSSQVQDTTSVAFKSHPRKWRDFRYVYPVISRRSRGLSIGINLSRDQVCQFNCVYCQVDRSDPPDLEPVDFLTLRAELETLLNDTAAIFQDAELSKVPAELRTLRDIAFSGDGEPTISPAFPAAAGLVGELRMIHGLDDVRVVVLTNGCNLRDARVVNTLAFLDSCGGEVWVKLDAGTPEHYAAINRSALDYEKLLENLLVTSRVRPIVIQSLFLRYDGHAPSDNEIAAYRDRLAALLDGGGQIKRVQVYTVARAPAETAVEPLSTGQLESIAEQIRPLGVPVETFV